MWRYTLTFILSSALAVFLWVVVSGVRTGREGPWITALLIVAGMLVLSFELLIHGVGSSFELKDRLRDDPGFARWIYRCGAMLGFGSSAVAVTIVFVLGKSWDTSPFYIELLPILLPIVVFVLGMVWIEQKAKSWSARPTQTTRTES